jgi:hypothetical protein
MNDYMQVGGRGPSFTRVEAWSLAALAAISNAAVLADSFCVLFTTSLGTCNVTELRMAYHPSLKEQRAAPHQRLLEH